MNIINDAIRHRGILKDIFSKKSVPYMLSNTVIW